MASYGKNECTIDSYKHKQLLCIMVILLLFVVIGMGGACYGND